MLVLNRRPMEGVKLIIPPSSEWREIKIINKKVRVTLAIDAPKDVKIIRNEIQNTKRH